MDTIFNSDGHASDRAARFCAELKSHSNLTFFKLENTKDAEHQAAHGGGRRRRQARVESPVKRHSPQRAPNRAGRR
jgi:hypothetical protein